MITPTLPRGSAAPNSGANRLTISKFISRGTTPSNQTTRGHDCELPINSALMPLSPRKASIPTIFFKNVPPWVILSQRVKATTIRLITCTTARFNHGHPCQQVPLEVKDCTHGNREDTQDPQDSRPK